MLILELSISSGLSSMRCWKSLIRVPRSRKNSLHIFVSMPKPSPGKCSVKILMVEMRGSSLWFSTTFSQINSKLCLNSVRTILLLGLYIPLMMNSVAFLIVPSYPWRVQEKNSLTSSCLIVTTAVQRLKAPLMICSSSLLESLRSDNRLARISSSFTCKS